MHKSIVLLFLVIAAGCSKNSGGSRFAGTWSGTYSSAMINSPGADTGTLRITVDAGNNATGTLLSFQSRGEVVMKGMVDPSTGAISISEYGKGDYGVIVFLEGLSGSLSADAGSGSLTYPWAAVSKWQAVKN